MLILSFEIPEALEIIPKQIFSVVSGATVLSIITKFFFFKYLPINLHAEIKFLIFGLFKWFTGVGTVTINISAEKFLILLLYINLIFDFLIW